MEVTREMKKRTKLLRKSIIELLATEAWKTMGYSSLRDYCKKEIPQCSYSQVIRIKKAMELHAKLEPESEYGIASEYVYRLVAGLKEDEQQRVWDNAKHLAMDLRGLKSRHIRVAYRITQLMDMKFGDTSPDYKFAKILHRDACELSR